MKEVVQDHGEKETSRNSDLWKLKVLEVSKGLIVASFCQTAHMVVPEREPDEGSRVNME